MPDTALMTHLRGDVYTVINTCARSHSLRKGTSNVQQHDGEREHSVSAMVSSAISFIGDILYHHCHLSEPPTERWHGSE